MPCSICGGSGKLPAIGVRSGKVLPHAFIWCSCHQDEEEHYVPFTPDNFDFPMSGTFRAWTFEESGRPDPGATRAPDITQEKQASASRGPALPSSDLQQIKTELRHLHNQVDRKFPPKPRGKY